MDLVFLAEEGQNHFLLELTEALADEVRQLGASASISRGYGPLARGRVYVMVSPHEWFWLSTGRPDPGSTHARS